MRLVTYNIRHGEHGLDQVADVLRRLAPDVVFVQEVDRGCKRSGRVDQAARLGELLEMTSIFGRAFDFDGGAYGVAILAKGPLADPRVHPLPHPSPRRDDGFGEPRIALTARWNGHLLACTHLGLSDAERVEQVAALRAIVGKDRRVLLGGDFNEGPGSAATKAVAGWLTDAFVESGATEEPTAPHDRPQARIDFVWRGADEPRATHGFLGPAGASDHRAVIVDLAESP